MIRSAAILLVIIAGAFTAIPTHSQVYLDIRESQHNGPVLQIGDPNATLAAFNYTYSQANLYTNSSTPGPVRSPSSNVTGTSFVWLSTINETSNNAKIPGTAFEFNITKSNIPVGRQVVNWTLTLPQLNCKGCTTVSVVFDFFGRITNGTSASYTLTLAPPNSTKLIQTQSFTSLGNFPSASVNCLEDFCVPIPAKYIGYNATLSFVFNWNTTSTSGMFADVGEIFVASISNFATSSSHFMQQDASDPNLILHTASLTQISYNNTLTTMTQPGNVSRTQQWWQIEVISIYFPAGYKIKQVNLNGTEIFPSYSLNPAEVPFESENCVEQLVCSQSLLALNMSDINRVVPHNSTITILATTPDAVSQLAPLSGGVTTGIFAPGDTLGLRTLINPAIVNASLAQQEGNLTIALFDHTGSQHVLPGQTFPTITRSGAVYNLTLPSTCSANICGMWTVNATFTSHYTLGSKSASFRIDMIQIASFTANGSNSALKVQGSLTYSDGSAATTANGVVFAVDSETTSAIPTPPITNTSSTGLYLANVTLVNGVFGQGQSLIMLFTIVNANNQTAYNATITMEHEWPGFPPQAHGVKANFTLGLGHLGELSFTRGPQSYKAEFSITGSGLKLEITSLSTGNFEPITVSKGTSPVSPTEAHTGMFKITMVTDSHGSPIITNSIETSPYAYVFGLPLAPSRYLASSSPFTGSSFQLTLKSDAILGARKLVVFALARDTSGIILVNDGQNPGFSDSTTLIPSMDPIGEVAVNQQVSTSIHLTSNSSSLTQNFTINLNLQGSNIPVASQSGIIIGPGKSLSITLLFAAPSTTGQYTLSISSPQYNGGVSLASQTLKVTVLQSNLQILIPAAIGVVAAIIVLGIYLIRKSPETKPEETTKKKPSSQKTKTLPSNNPPSKSLTQTGDKIR